MILTLRDPLAELLGAAEGGLLSYSYADAVKLAGHSCPTVAGAYRATRDALLRLYRDETPVRGAVRVEPRGAAQDGVVGVVAGYITGASVEASLPQAPLDDDIKRLLRGALIPGAPPAHREAFARAWQERVERVLRSH